MNNVIQFPNSDVKEYRQKCCFMNRAVQVEGEDGELQKYPCIVLYEEETDIPILYTGLERYLCHLVKSELLNGKTLSAKAYAICHFLNYILKETDINSLHECTLGTVRGFLKSMKTKEDGTETADSMQAEQVKYIINTNTGKFHKTECNSVAKMKAKNKKEFTGSREKLIAEGYEPCGNCRP